MYQREDDTWTVDESQFIMLEAKDGGILTFVDNGKGKVNVTGNIKITPSIFIKSIMLIGTLKYNST